jgi:hypothetical protein
MLGELERPLEAELTAHLGYGQARARRNIALTHASALTSMNKVFGRSKVSTSSQRSGARVMEGFLPQYVHL